VKARCVILVLALSLALFSAQGAAEEPDDSMPSLSDVSSLVNRLGEESSDTLATPIKIVLLVTLLSMLPAVLMLATAFPRIVIVLAFVRRALTTRSIPPNTVLIGLGLFLSLFVMSPTLAAINRQALQPYLNGNIGAAQALSEGVQPLRQFMFRQTREAELALFVSMSGMERPATPADVPTHVLIPAFVIGELKRAFELGFVLFLPFLIVDLVVASVLLSMGMMMLPPVIVSAPLKILLFILVDGWNLIAESLMLSFAGG